MVSKSILALYLSYKQAVHAPSHGTRGDVRWSVHSSTRHEATAAAGRDTSDDPGSARQATSSSAESIDSITRSTPALRAAVLGTLGHASRFWMTVLNSTQIINPEHIRAVTERAPGTPVVTVCNHVSALDDPFVLAAVLPPGFAFAEKAEDVRWTFCATDRCFKHKLLEPLFRAGKVLPLERGAGVHQGGMEAAAGRLRQGDWVHIFPEGTRGRDSSAVGSARRGVGHLVSSAVVTQRGGALELLPSSPPTPVIVPFIHAGLERVVPRGAWCPRVGQAVTVIVGEPIAVDDVVEAALAEGWSQRALDNVIAARVEGHMRALHCQLHGLELPEPAPVEHASELRSAAAPRTQFAEAARPALPSTSYSTAPWNDARAGCSARGHCRRWNTRSCDEAGGDELPTSRGGDVDGACAGGRQEQPLAQNVFRLVRQVARQRCTVTLRTSWLPDVLLCWDKYWEERGRHVSQLLRPDFMHA